MKPLAMLLMMAILLGCTAQTTAEEPVPDTEQPYHPELPDTSLISFTREPFQNYTPGPGVPSFDFSNKTDAEGRLIVYYFYSPGCVASKAITPEIDRLEEGYPNVVFLRYDLATVNGSYAYKEFAAEYNLSPDKQLVPQVLVDGTIITDRFNINQSLEDTIISFTGNG